MAYQPRQVVWYLDQSGNVQTGLFAGHVGGNVEISVAQGNPLVVMRDVDVFGTYVAASRASVQRASIRSNRSQPGGASFIKK